MLRFLRGSGAASATNPPAAPAAPASQPEPAIVPDQIRDALDSLLPLDYLFEPNIGQLQTVFDNAADKDECRTRLARFFVAHPDKLKLLDTPYFHHHHRGKEVFDLIVAAANYASGKVEQARDLVSPHAREATTTFYPFFLARILSALGDTAEESAILDDLLKRFPDDPIVVLSCANHALVQGRTAEANAFLDKVRTQVEEHLRDEIEAVKASAEDLAAAIRDGVLSRSSKFDIYDDDLTRATWLGYYERFITQGRNQTGDGFLIDYLDQAITGFCQRNDVRSVLDFGSLCAEIVARPARKLPDTHFVGIDRQAFVATMNYEAYQHPNMSFESGDIMDYLPKFAERPGRKLLLHVRTTCLLYPDLVKKIYSAARDAGVEYIMLWEGDGLSRDHLRYFDFDDMPAVTVARKGVLFNHNYKAILDECGYQIEEAVRLPSIAIQRDITDLVGATLFLTARLKDIEPAG